MAVRDLTGRRCFLVIPKVKLDWVLKEIISLQELEEWLIGIVCLDRLGEKSL